MYLNIFKRWMCRFNICHQQKESVSVFAVLYHSDFLSSNLILSPKSWETFIFFQQCLDAGVSGCLTVGTEMKCRGTQQCEGNAILLGVGLLHLHRHMIELNWCYTLLGWHRLSYPYGYVWVPCFRSDLSELNRKVSKCSFKIILYKTLNRNCYASVPLSKYRLVCVLYNRRLFLQERQVLLVY